VDGWSTSKGFGWFFCGRRGVIDWAACWWDAFFGCFWCRVVCGQVVFYGKLRVVGLGVWGQCFVWYLEGWALLGGV